MLTTWHVVSGNRPGEELAIVMPDGKEHQADEGTIQRIGKVDMADKITDKQEQDTAFNKALISLNKAIELNPNLGFRAFQARANLKKNLGLLSDALEDWDLIIEREKDKLVWMYTERAKIFLELNRKEDALSDLEIALSLDMDIKWNRGALPEALAQHALLARDLGDLPLACSSVKRSIDLEDEGVWERRHSFSKQGWWTNDCNISVSFD